MKPSKLGHKLLVKKQIVIKQTVEKLFSFVEVAYWIQSIFVAFVKWIKFKNMTGDFLIFTPFSHSNNNVN